MINRTVLVGRLTRDPEIRHTQGGTAVASFTLAVNRQFTNSQGEREADFINCVIWGKAAENFANFTNKGSLVGIDGRIQTSSYEKDGQRVYRTDVIVENFSKLEWDNDSNGQSGQHADNQASKSNNTNDYSQKRADNVQKNNNTDPFADKSKPIDISDDDLPF